MVSTTRGRPIFTQHYINIIDREGQKQLDRAGLFLFGQKFMVSNGSSSSKNNTNTSKQRPDHRLIDI